jgi:hypothetical protein
MTPFLIHVRSCDVCRPMPSKLCDAGVALFEECAWRLARQVDGKRGKA